MLGALCVGLGAGKSSHTILTAPTSGLFYLLWVSLPFLSPEPSPHPKERTPCCTIRSTAFSNPPALGGHTLSCRD